MTTSPETTNRTPEKSDGDRIRDERSKLSRDLAKFVMEDGSDSTKVREAEEGIQFADELLKELEDGAKHLIPAETFSATSDGGPVVAHEVIQNPNKDPYAELRDLPNEAVRRPEGELGVQSQVYFDEFNPREDEQGKTNNE